MTDAKAIAVGSCGSQLKEYISSLWHLLRVILFLTSVVYAAMLYLGYHGAHLSSSGDVPAGNNTTVKISPLQDLLNRGHSLESQVLDSEDSTIMKKIYDQSTVELKTVVIAETVVPCNDRNLLSMYVKQQLVASDVMSEAQKEAVLAMVHMAPAEAIVNKEELGEMGTLRNSAILAFLKKHETNMHFMLIGVRAEPRLGWKWISHAERNSWNDVLSRVLTNKIRKEAKNYIGHREATISYPAKP